MLSRLFRRRSCPLPTARQRRGCLRPHHFVPLVGFLIPTIVIAYGIVLPRNGVGGVNELSVGFGGTLIGAAVTYALGMAAVVRR